MTATVVTATKATAITNGRGVKLKLKMFNNPPPDTY